MFEIKKPRLEVRRGIVKYCEDSLGILKYCNVLLQLNCNQSSR